MRRHLTLAAATTALLVGGCDGLIHDPTGGAPSAGGGDADRIDHSAEPLACAAEDLRPAEAPLRRLTPIEYRNTVRDLFPAVALPRVELVAGAEVQGYDNNAAGQVVSPLLVEQYQVAAAAIGAAVAADGSWLPCDPAADEVACGRVVAASLAERAYRRPLDEVERTRAVTFFDAARSSFGFSEAIAMLVEGLLQSPAFLYRPEVGVDAGAPAGLVRLGPYEIASRLSYALWHSMPDDALLAAAAADELGTTEEIEAQARRMLADPRAAAVVADFHRQWLDLGAIEELQLSPERYPELTPSLRDALRDATQLFLERTFFEGGSYRDLLTATHAYANDELAALYGIPAPGSDELVRVELDPAERAGILTQPGLLASTSHGLGHSPILRGVMVLDAFLCMPPPPPPPDVDAAIDDEDTGGEVRTTRERIELTHGTAECASCHDAIDGAGFSFERYDALGRFRTHENGVPVDPTGAFAGTRDVDGEVADAIELAQRLADSAQAEECFATHWFRHAMGRTERAADRCQIQALAAAMREGGDLRELLVALVTSPSFRFRPSE